MYLEIKNNLDENMNLHKNKSGFLNTYRTLHKAVTYLKTLSTTQNYKMTNINCVK